MGIPWFSDNYELIRQSWLNDVEAMYVASNYRALRVNLLMNLKIGYHGIMAISDNSS